MSAAVETARGIVDSLRDPALLLDAELRVVTLNQAYVGMSGLRKRTFDDRVGKGIHPFQIIAMSDHHDESHARDCLDRKKRLHLAEVTIRNAVDQAMIVNISFIPVLEGDRVVGVIEILQDVTDVSSVQQRFKELMNLERVRADELERQVELRTRELTAAFEEVQRLSRTDPVTGLLNRRAFAEHAEQALALAARHGRSVGFLLCDLDHFKRVNDTYGHLAGDAMLNAVAKELMRLHRTSDKVARYGGEEFVILLSETASDSVLATAERYRNAIRAIPVRDFISTFAGEQTVSIGAAVFPQHGTTLDELLGNADHALYRAKRSGRDRAMIFDATVEEKKTKDKIGSGPRVLVVAGQADDICDVLAKTYQVVRARSVEDALQLCEGEHFDVLVAHHVIDGHDGVDFLHATLRTRPDALRVLLIDEKSVFMEMRGTALARVDCFVLRKDVNAYLLEAIEHSTLRREVDHQRLLRTSASAKSAFVTQIGELEEVLEKRALRFDYQPIVDSNTMEVRAYEALCRVDHPLFKNPVVLFDAALRSGNIWRLGRMVREVATTVLRELPDNIHVFVNLHPAEIDDPSLTDKLLPEELARRVVFELTERTAIPDFARFREKLNGLREQGYRYAVDDLGAGYASLNSVALLSPDFVKIDMALIRDIHKTPRKASLARRMVQFTRDVGIKAVAEGVETKEEAEAVRTLGFDLMQGYLVGRPGPLPR